MRKNKIIRLDTQKQRRNNGNASNENAEMINDDKIFEKTENKDKNTRLDRRKQHRNNKNVSNENIEKIKDNKAHEKVANKEENIHLDARKTKLKKHKENALHTFASKVGKTKIAVYGKNAVRAIGAISKLYRVEDVTFSSDGVAFLVNSKHCDKIIALLNNLCYDYKIIGEVGALPRSIIALSRIGLIVGIALVVAMLFVYPSFVTNISVQSVGDVALSKALNDSICDILLLHGIQSGKRLAKVDFKDVKNEILALNDVAFASVERLGTHIKIVIKQSTPNDIFDISGSSVRASKQAVVTRIVVESGTAVKKYGDVVNIGDTLIDGYVEYGDEKIPIEAQGYAYGKVYYHKRVFFSNTQLVKTYGDTKTVTKFSMFGKTPKTPTPPFECCECKMTVQNLGFLLPIDIYTYTFTQIEIVEQANAMSDDEMIDSVYSSIVATFEEQTTVLDKYCKIENGDGGKYVDVTVEAEELI